MPGGRDPLATEGTDGVLRGGSWRTFAANCRSARRLIGHSQLGYWDDLGFRVARVPSLPPEPDRLVGTKAGETRDENGLKLTLVWCPPGTFTMGSSMDEPERSADEEQVQVALTQGFWLGRTEVTQGQWQAVMGTKPWSEQPYVLEGVDNAATNISWVDAAEFCHKLTEQERQAGRLPAGWEYALPTEAQWEYACRAGTTTPYSYSTAPLVPNLTQSLLGQTPGVPRLGEGSSVVDSAYFDFRQRGSEKLVHDLGSKAANPWGLLDVHRGVFEWCRDWYAEKLPGGRDPLVTTPSEARVLRGGAWGLLTGTSRSAFRLRAAPSDLNFSRGLRVARVPTGR
jgi:formylglycine-generating enzyme required for sulfatase activity